MQDYNEIYQAIGQEAVDAIDADWETVTLTAECVSDTSWGFVGRYIDNNGDTQGFRVSPKVPALFKKLRQYYIDNLESPWKKATLKINSDGKFDMAFEYEVAQK